jgi:hypothetical protein
LDRVTVVAKVCLAKWKVRFFLIPYISYFDFLLQKFLHIPSGSEIVFKGSPFQYITVSFIVVVDGLQEHSAVGVFFNAQEAIPDGFGSN